MNKYFVTASLAIFILASVGVPISLMHCAMCNKNIETICCPAMTGVSHEGSGVRAVPCVTIIHVGTPIVTIAHVNVRVPVRLPIALHAIASTVIIQPTLPLAVGKNIFAHAPPADLSRLCVLRI